MGILGCLQDGKAKAVPDFPNLESVEFGAVKGLLPAIRPGRGFPSPGRADQVLPAWFGFERFRRHFHMRMQHPSEGGDIYA
jgi:hypothetical protein